MVQQIRIAGGMLIALGILATIPACRSYVQRSQNTVPTQTTVAELPPSLSGPVTSPPPLPPLAVPPSVNPGPIPPPMVPPNAGYPLPSVQIPPSLNPMPTPSTPPIAPTSSPAPGSIDELITKLAAIRAKKNELEKVEGEITAILKEKLKQQQQRLRTLGVQGVESLPIAPDSTGPAPGSTEAVPAPATIPQRTSAL